MTEFKHTSYSLGFKVSKELLADDCYKQEFSWLKKVCDNTLRRINEILFSPGPLWRVRKRHAPPEEWPPSPDDLNERWWE